jgi:hypothetical protein
VEKRNAFEEWLYRRVEESTATDEFRRHSTARICYSTTEKFGLIAWWSQQGIEEAFTTL